MIGCIIQARMKSQRLPGKVMMNVEENNPLLNSVISQIEFSKLTEKFVIATSDSKEDDTISEFLKNKTIDCFRGCLLYTSPSPRDGLLSRMPSSA